MTSKDTTSAISSPVSADGHTLSGLPDGETIDLFGPDHAPVSRSAPPDSGKELMTPATSGPNSCGLSPTETLQSSLESRLRQKLDVNGSPEYVLTWKHWDIALGPPICALRARALRISDKGYGGWPTPMAGSPGKPGRYNPAGNTDSSRKTVALLTGWATPRANEGTGDKIPPSRQGGLALKQQAQLAGWSTPRANKWGFPDSHGSNETPISGTNSTSPNAATGKRGVLNPDHPRWLMGYPIEWAFCGAMATRSTRKSGKNS